MSQARPRWLLYGATGTLGMMVAEAAAASGERPLLAGQDAGGLAEVGERLGLPHQAIDLGQRDAMDRILSGHRVLLNCAGPFPLTAANLVQGCLRSGVHYLDVSGAMSDHRAIQRFEERANEAGILLCPGVGHEVLPCDVLAAHLAKRMPDAARLDLGFALHRVALTRTALADLRAALSRAGLRVQRGELVEAPRRLATRKLEFEAGKPRTARAFPWRADALCALRTTGIPNIELWADLPFRLDRLVAWHRALDSGLGARWLDLELRHAPTKPSNTELRHGRCEAVAEVVNEDGRRLIARMRGPGPHRLGVLLALAAVRRILEQPPEPGLHSPGQVLDVETLRGIEELSFDLP